MSKIERNYLKGVIRISHKLIFISDSISISEDPYPFLSVESFWIHLLFRTKTVEAARADGERIKLIGAAEAKAVEAVGR